MEDNSVPFTDRLVHSSINTKMGKYPFMVLSPMGVPVKPQCLEQLIIALYCVLKALKSLHSLSIMHCDIRWENVMKNVGKDMWFIIDFDDACSSPSPGPSKVLDTHSHAPEISKRPYNASADIWSVGYLITRASVKSESEPLTNYARKMMDDDYTERPTADESLVWLCHNFADILSAGLV